MPTLDWIGKNKVINHHMDVPYRVLEPQDTYGEDSGNMIIHGDNLSALKSFLPQYERKIRCIYINIIFQSLIQSRGIIEKCAFAV